MKAQAGDVDVDDDGGDNDDFDGVLVACLAGMAGVAIPRESCLDHARVC